MISLYEDSEEGVTSNFKVSDIGCLLTLSPARCNSPKDKHLLCKPEDLYDNN
jgi:hypothetical protein